MNSQAVAHFFAGVLIAPLLFPVGVRANSGPDDTAVGLRSGQTCTTIPNRDAIETILGRAWEDDIEAEVSAEMLAIYNFVVECNRRRSN